MALRLVGIEGEWKNASFRLGDYEFTIGRDAECDLQVNDENVSRRHCVIRSSVDGCAIRDLGSHNGTFINGVSRAEYDLKPGDEVRIGKSVFLLLTTVPTSDTDTSTFEFSAEQASHLFQDPSWCAVSTLATRDMQSLLRVSVLLYSF